MPPPHSCPCPREADRVTGVLGQVMTRAGRATVQPAAHSSRHRRSPAKACGLLAARIAETPHQPNLSAESGERTAVICVRRAGRLLAFQLAAIGDMAPRLLGHVRYGTLGHPYRGVSRCVPVPASVEPGWTGRDKCPAMSRNVPIQHAVAHGKGGSATSRSPAAARRDDRSGIFQ